MCWFKYFYVLCVVCGLFSSGACAMDIEQGRRVQADCSICLQALPEEGSVRYESKVICGEQLFGCSAEHVFHADCIIAWIKSCVRNNLPVTCPICRSLAQLPLSAAVPVRARRAFYCRHRSIDYASVCAVATLILTGFGTIAYALIIINST